MTAPHRLTRGRSWGRSLAGLVAATATALAAVSPEPIPFKAPAKFPDRASVLSPAAIQLKGFLGQRVAVNEANRLLKVDEEPLLAGFRKKPGVHPWIGEHIGKWMHAATLAWANTGDAALRAKLDRVASELVKAQEPDGYLGTYTPDKRFGLFQGADWDVWSHKYNLLGLLTYHQFTGNEAALDCCRRMGDLLIATFGPGKKSILAAGTHVGMAATSVLEPMVLLYRHTGEERYLAFARYLVSAWDEPKGPKIIAALLTAKQVNKTANGKAYELLSNLVGLCELVRATGDTQLLEAVLNAWGDIVARRLYLTGSASQGEHFHEDFDLPNQMSAAVAETCVTTTWIQLNLQLLRLTGGARFGEELERTLYNHLAAAQRPDGAQWCYFTSLEGAKPYGPGINCCVSSGPRGMALAPQAAWLKYRVGEHDGLAMNLFDGARVVAELGGQTVTLEHKTEFPRRGAATVTFRLGQPATFAFRVRTPAWAAPLMPKLNGQTIPTARRDEGWFDVPAREWHDKDTLELGYTVAARVARGQYGNLGKDALAWGPFILAYDTQRNPSLPHPGVLRLVAEPGDPPFTLREGPALVFDGRVEAFRRSAVERAVFVPFADAGDGGGAYRVWLRAPGVAFPENESLLAFGEESRSREGNVGGAIADGDLGTYVVTFNGRPAAEDWFAVSVSPAVSIRRVVFAHGKTFHDGGWFDTSGGKPRIQARREAGGAWETVGELADYPVTSATDDGRLKSGQTFTLRLPAAMSVVALRVVGKPASGDDPGQAFSSAAELQAFGE